MQYNELLELRLLKSYNAFGKREYEDGWDTINSLPNDGILDVAYTEDDTESHALEVKYNYKTNKYLYIVDSNVVKETKASVEEFITDLGLNDFSDIIRPCFDFLDEEDE